MSHARAATLPLLATPKAEAPAKAPAKQPAKAPAKPALPDPETVLARLSKMTPTQVEYIAYLLALDHPALFDQLEAAGAETLAFLRARS